MPPHPLNRFQKQKHYQNEPKFNDVCSRYNLTKTKNDANVMNLEYKSIQIHWIALYVNGNNRTVSYGAT